MRARTIVLQMRGVGILFVCVVCVCVCVCVPALDLGWRTRIAKRPWSHDAVTILPGSFCSA